MPSISVIIPVYNDPDRLIRCIKSVIDNTHAVNEIIIVDNGSTPAVRLPETLSSKNITLLQENEIGSYAARNTGLRHSTGEIIGFTDADCIVDKYWIEKAIMALEENPGAGFLGGKICMFSESIKIQNTIEKYELLFSLNQKKYIRYGRFAATANMWSRRKTFTSIGLFNQNLSSSGDKEWGNRVVAAGFEAIYCEDVIVNHPVRDSVKQLRSKNIRIGAGFYDNSRGFTDVMRNMMKLVIIGKHRAKDLFFAMDLDITDKIKLFLVILLERLYTFAGFFGRMLTARKFR